ncbi:DUF6286 domain-containing protein [Actinomadura parmotrematis]|uniref:DUF6286 domain-containing protein n=1 Tax=Actinomadura parmotrematis TaxID=2864039 RepID=A0ABS7FTS5_9ACTN|nr:DUF6286 domain-containing protein [Actinomadura parmotrematis]MBW8483809.1 hypothetical protein [Actinomadura parmotrematis]
MGETLVTELIEDVEARQRAGRLALGEFRARRTALGIAVALLVAGATGTAALEILSRMAGWPAGLLPVHRIAAGLRATAWHDRRVVAAGGLMLAAGVALAAAALPGRLRMVPLRGGDGDLAAGLSRAAVVRVLDEAVRAVPGVERSRVRLRGLVHRRVEVRAHTGFRNAGNLPELIRAAVGERMERLGLLQSRTVEVQLSWRRD